MVDRFGLQRRLDQSVNQNDFTALLRRHLCDSECKLYRIGLFVEASTRQMLDFER